MRVRNKRFWEISWRDVKNYFRMGRYLETREVDDYLSLPYRVFAEMDPVFVLSTGRCGTELLVRLFKGVKSVMATHEPTPRVYVGSRMAYEMGREEMDARKLAFLSARYDILKHAFLSQKRYVETGNRMTFFADAIAELFPRSGFLHVVRHPGSFVRSGMRRNYYAGNENDDGRLVPTSSDPVSRDWNEFTRIEKVGWLWNETNRFIENIKAGLENNRVLLVKSEEMFTDAVVFMKICDFLRLDAPQITKIERIISRPRNVQRRGAFPPYEAWTDEQKQQLTSVTQLASTYGYSLG